MKLRLSVALCLSLLANTALATDLTVLSFNVWGAGANDGKSIDETIAVIRKVDADIIAVLETKPEPDPCTAEACVANGPSRAGDIAKALGYHVYEQTKVNSALWANAIISRYPIVGPTANDLGVEINVSGRKVFAFGIHLTDYPYQPYQLLSIPYGAAPFLKTAEEAVMAARATRGPALDLLEQDMKSADGADAAFVMGDFNEPSHRDWTDPAVKAGLQPLVVAYPTVMRVESWGFVDTLRVAHPDVVAKPAFTWTPTSAPDAKDDHHDRIDFVLARGATLEVREAGIVGEKTPEADIVVTPWPSDHRAAYARVRF